MSSRKLKSIVFMVSVIALLGLSSLALAGSGRGHGGGYGCGRGADAHWQATGGHGPGSCWRDEFSEEEIQKINQGRKAFREETASLRRQIYAQGLALESEMAQEKPDAQQAAALQKELSQLKGELAQKRITHRLKMKDINPNAGRGWRGGYHGKGNCCRKGGGYGCRQ